MATHPDHVLMSHGLIFTKRFTSVTYMLAFPEFFWINIDYVYKCTESLIIILFTVFGRDHSGGNKEWKKKFPSIEIYGGKSENVPAVTQ